MVLDGSGLSVETVLALINKGALSLAFLDGPVMALPERLDRFHYDLVATTTFHADEAQALCGAPEPDERATLFHHAEGGQASRCVSENTGGGGMRRSCGLGLCVRGGRQW